jgi:hypothetical protein
MDRADAIRLLRALAAAGMNNPRAEGEQGGTRENQNLSRVQR